MRIQLGQGSAAQVTSTMLKNEGVAAFYKVFYFVPMFFLLSMDFFHPIKLWIFTRLVISALGLGDDSNVVCLSCWL